MRCISMSLLLALLGACAVQGTVGDNEHKQPNHDLQRSRRLVFGRSDDLLKAFFEKSIPHSKKRDLDDEQQQQHHVRKPGIRLKKSRPKRDLHKKRHIKYRQTKTFNSVNSPARHKIQRKRHTPAHSPKRPLDDLHLAGEGRLKRHAAEEGLVDEKLYGKVSKLGFPRRHRPRRQLTGPCKVLTVWIEFRERWYDEMNYSNTAQYELMSGNIEDAIYTEFDGDTNFGYSHVLMLRKSRKLREDDNVYNVMALVNLVFSSDERDPAFHLRSIVGNGRISGMVVYRDYVVITYQGEESCKAYSAVRPDELRAEILLNVPWDPEYGNPKSAQYQDLASKLEKALKKLLGPDYNVHVLGFRNKDGNTLATISITYPKGVPNPEDLLRKILKSGFIGPIPVDPDYFHRLFPPEPKPLAPKAPKYPQVSTLPFPSAPAPPPASYTPPQKPHLPELLLNDQVHAPKQAIKQPPPLRQSPVPPSPPSSPAPVVQPPGYPSTRPYEPIISFAAPPPAPPPPAPPPFVYKPPPPFQFPTTRHHYAPPPPPPPPYYPPRPPRPPPAPVSPPPPPPPPALPHPPYMPPRPPGSHQPPLAVPVGPGQRLRALKLSSLVVANAPNPPPELPEPLFTDLVPLPEGLPESCEQVRQRRIATVDGEYIIKARQGCHLNIICQNMDELHPKEYLGGPSQKHWLFWRYAVLIRISAQTKRSINSHACLENTEVGRRFIRCVFNAGETNGHSMSSWRLNIKRMLHKYTGDPMVMRRKRDLEKDPNQLTLIPHETKATRHQLCKD